MRFGNLSVTTSPKKFSQSGRSAKPSGAGEDHGALSALHTGGREGTPTEQPRTGLQCRCSAWNGRRLASRCCFAH